MEKNRRATGLFFSTTTFAQKIGAAVPVELVGWLLTIVNYDGAAIQQTDETITSTKLSFSVIFGALYLLIGGLLFFYDPRDEKVERIKLELPQRERKVNTGTI